MSNENIKKKKMSKYKRHGMRNTRIYGFWSGMKYRCDNKNSKDYKNYGARGISYCEQWSLFINFYQDMKNGYSDDLTLDRIDNDKNYNPNNCRWIPKGEQGKNKRYGWRKILRNPMNGRFCTKEAMNLLKENGYEIVRKSE